MQRENIFCFFMVTLLLMCFSNAFASSCRTFSVINNTPKEAFFYFETCPKCQSYDIAPYQEVSGTICIPYSVRSTMIIVASVDWVKGNMSSNFMYPRRRVFCRDVIPASSFTWIFDKNKNCEYL